VAVFLNFCNSDIIKQKKGSTFMLALNFSLNPLASQISEGGVSEGVPYSFLSPFPHCHLEFLHQGMPWGDVELQPPFSREVTRMTFNEWINVTYDVLFEEYDNADISISPKRLRKLAIGKATRAWYNYGYAGGFPPDFLLKKWQEKQIRVINNEVVEFPSLLQFNEFNASELWGGNNPPVTNRGVYLTEQPNMGITLSIDWFSWTLNFADKIPDLTSLRDFLVQNVGVASDIQKGRFNIQYTCMQIFGDVLRLYWSDKPEATTGRFNVHIAASGGALGVLASKGWETPDKVFLFAMRTFIDTRAVSWWPSRIDWAIDDFTGTMTTDKVVEAMEAGTIETKFRREPDPRSKKGGWRFIRNFGGNEKIGRGLTAYFGNGEKVIRFYNKAVEQNYDDVWHRAEMQLRAGYARDMTTALIGRDYKTIFRIVAGYFRSSLDFKIPDPNDSNMGRWQTAQWWTDFCGSDKYRLVRPKFEPRLDQTLDWLSRVSGCFATVAQLGYQLSTEPTEELRKEAGKNVFLSFLEMGQEIMASSKARQRQSMAMIDNFILKRQQQADKPEKEIRLKNGRCVPLSGLYQGEHDDFNDLLLQAQHLGGVPVSHNTLEYYEMMNQAGAYEFVF